MRCQLSTLSIWALRLPPPPNRPQPPWSPLKTLPAHLNTCLSSPSVSTKPPPLTLALTPAPSPTRFSTLGASHPPLCWISGAARELARQWLREGIVRQRVATEGDAAPRGEALLVLFRSPHAQAELALGPRVRRQAHKVSHVSHVSHVSQPISPMSHPSVLLHNTRFSLSILRAFNFLTSTSGQSHTPHCCHACSTRILMPPHPLPIPIDDRHVFFDAQSHAVHATRASASRCSCRG